jgi:hypothetical protein
MRVELLHVTDCPNLPLMLEHLRRVTDTEITTHEITTDVDAAKYGMTGSPTLLIDGADPFGSPDLAAGLSCRIYRDEHGATVPVPSVCQLRAAVGSS